MRFRRGTIDGGSDRRFGKTGSATATLDGLRLIRRLNGSVARLLLLFSSLLQARIGTFLGFSKPFYLQRFTSVSACAFWFLGFFFAANVPVFLACGGGGWRRGKERTQQWEDDWDDDDVNDDFSLQLRRDLENNTEKS
ncbi:hypothetical protein CsSME_00013930 [Camellia sinensis var. sinensis]